MSRSSIMCGPLPVLFLNMCDYDDGDYDDDYDYYDDHDDHDDFNISVCVGISAKLHFTGTERNSF